MRHAQRRGRCGTEGGGQGRGRGRSRSLLAGWLAPSRFIQYAPRSARVQSSVVVQCSAVYSYSLRSSTARHERAPADTFFRALVQTPTLTAL